jgi:hypothetical protein
MPKFYQNTSDSPITDLFEYVKESGERNVDAAWIIDFDSLFRK